ncbi:hypothetical protein [Streptomyces sp. NPDC020996]|uniref:hypothetical protein n=1 Tax=Streptomyces sp. NPDC020996 TaxID=3154791 RepID=UPI003409A8D5
MNTLVIDVRVEAGRARLGPRGELVQGCADTLAATLAGLPGGIDRIDLDMSGVVFMDTAGPQFLDHLGAYGDRHHVTVRTAHWKPKEAWDILREASQLSNTKLRTVAAAVTAGAGGDGPPPPPALRRALHTAAARCLS